MKMLKHELNAHLDRLVTQQKQYLTNVLNLMNQACESEKERESFFRILSGRMDERLDDDEMSVFESISNTEVIEPEPDPEPVQPTPTEPTQPEDE